MFICPCIHSQSYTCSDPGHVSHADTLTCLHHCLHKYLNECLCYTLQCKCAHIHIQVHTTHIHTRACWAHTGIFKLRISDSSQPCLLRSPVCMTSCCCKSGMYQSQDPAGPPQPSRASEWLEGPPWQASSSVCNAVAMVTDSITAAPVEGNFCVQSHRQTPE